MGRSVNGVPNNAALGQNVKKQDRYLLIQQMTDDFWKRWVTEVTPMHIIRQKWHANKRNLKPGDIVLVHDKSMFKRKYTLAVVESVKMSQDGLVRSCIVIYKIPSSKDKIDQYTGSKVIRLSRSVQKLTLLLSVEEQDQKMSVEDGLIVNAS